MIHPRDVWVEVLNEAEAALLTAFVAWYREGEALAKAHPRVWYRPTADIRRLVAERVRALYPEPLPCPCAFCVDCRARLTEQGPPSGKTADSLVPRPDAGASVASAEAGDASSTRNTV